jgi:metallo-beta-lactamase family protein
MRWVRNIKSDPQVHVVHGETEAKQAFRDRLESELHLQASVPAPGDTLEL